MNNDDGNTRDTGYFSTASGREMAQDTRSLDDTLTGASADAVGPSGSDTSYQGYVPTTGGADAAGVITNDYSDITNPGTTTVDEEFAGTSGADDTE